MKTLIFLSTLLILLGSCSSLNNHSSSSIQKRKYNKGFFISKKAPKNSVKNANNKPEEFVSNTQEVELIRPEIIKENKSQEKIQPVIISEENTVIASTEIIEKETIVSSKTNLDEVLQPSTQLESTLESKQKAKAEKKKPEHLGRSITLIVLGGLKLILSLALIIAFLYTGSLIILILWAFHFLTGATLFTIGNVSLFRSIKKSKESEE